jgi:hypothetical protein
MSISLNSLLKATFAGSLICLFTSVLHGQCNNSFSFGSATAPATAAPVTISTCNFAGDYSTVSGIVAGSTYEIGMDLGGCVTVRSGTPGGPVVASGNAPLSFTAPSSGTYYIHFNTNCACGTASSCIETTITCTSCGGGGGTGPCASITPIIGCGTNTGATVSGTGAGWDIGSCGFSTPGTEIIFSFTATATGIHSIDINSANGGFVDMFWVEASAGCSPTAGWNCISDFFTTGNYGAMNWVAGTTYYILFDPEGTGAYDWTFDVNCPNPGGPVTASDCPTREPVCTNLAFQVDPNGFGTIDELCTNCTSNPSTNPSSANSGCLLNGELNSTWFEVNVAVGGTLEFSFGTPASGNCFDWIMWPLNATACDDILAGTHAPISCNWNAPCDGFTGAGTLPTGGLAGNFEPAMNVNAGDQFIICFSNFSSALTTVPLDFFGTADISCTTLPLPVGLIDFEGEDMGGYNLLQWKTGAELNNDGFIVERSIDGETYETIGFVDGIGTTLEMTEYNFKDLDPTRSITYYRLKQLDFDGTITLSNVITVVQEDIKAMQVVSAYPNPATSNFNVDLVVSRDETVELEILSTGGKVLRTTSEKLQQGVNMLEFDVSDLDAGMYLIRILNGDSGESDIVRFVVE